MNPRINSRDILKQEISRLCRLYNNVNILTDAQMEAEIAIHTTSIGHMTIRKKSEIQLAGQYPLPHLIPQAAIGYLSFNPPNEKTCIRPATSVEVPSSTERSAALHQVCVEFRELNQTLEYFYDFDVTDHYGETEDEIDARFDEIQREFDIIKNTKFQLEKENIAARKIEEKAELKYKASIARQEVINNTVVVPTEQLASPCSDLCGICLETHNKCDIVHTECGHEFGKECWNMFIKSRKQYGVFHCPGCRKTNPKVKTFACKKPRRLGLTV